MDTVKTWEQCHKLYWRYRLLKLNVCGVIDCFYSLRWSYSNSRSQIWVNKRLWRHKRSTSRFDLMKTVCPIVLNCLWIITNKYLWRYIGAISLNSENHVPPGFRLFAHAIATCYKNDCTIPSWWRRYYNCSGEWCSALRWGQRQMGRAIPVKIPLTNPLLSVFVSDFCRRGAEFPLSAKPNVWEASSHAHFIFESGYNKYIFRLTPSTYIK